LQLEIKKNIEKELAEYLKNPFCLLPIDIKSLGIHLRQEIPGAAEAEKAKEKKEGGRTGKTSNLGGGSNAAQSHTLTGVEKVRFFNQKFFDFLI
jgi:hypothetical protein